MKKIIRQLGYIVAAIIIGSLLLISIGRLCTPLLNRHLPDFESWSTKILQVPVKIGHVEIAWNVFEPELVFDHVVMLDRKTLQQRFSIEQIKVNLNILYSLILWQPVPDRIKIVGSHLTIHQPTSDKILIDEFKDLAVADSDTQTVGKMEDVVALIFTQPNLTLENIDVNYYLPSGKLLALTLEKIVLKNKTNKHQLSGDMRLNQAKPTHLHGTLTWTGNVTHLDRTKGKFYFNCEGLSLYQWFPQLFAGPLDFSQINGNLQFQKTNDGIWFLNLKHFNALNSEFKAHGSLTLKFPPQDSPTINLSANFAMANASHIVNYLPIKIFHPDLAKWLNSAFGGGIIEGGTALVQGRLADFPFETGTGKFLISGRIQDLELHYATKWPSLQHVNGILTFAGSTMSAQIASGKLLNIPVKDLQALIPYIGDRGPQILHLQGNISSDFKNAFNFIQHSPLQNTLGKNLAALDIVGPMNLQLGLIIPLHTPENTQVKGDLTSINATLKLPLNDLGLSQLNGVLHFTDQSIQASHLTGIILGEVATLDLQPQAKTNYVEATLRSHVSIDALEKWLKQSLHPFFVGRAAYQAHLVLTPQSPAAASQVSMQSDLQGIAINLPTPFEKKADKVSQLTMDVTIPQNQPLLAKINYEQISALLSLKKTANDWKLERGVVHIGEGLARLPTQAGFFIVAQFNKLNSTVLEPFYNLYKFMKQSTAVNKADNLPALFKGLEVNANTAEFFDQSFSHVKLTLANNNNNWQAIVNSEQVQGHINVSADFSSINADFQKFYWQTSKGSGMNLESKKIPTLNLSINDFRYGDMRLGNLMLKGVPTQEGWQLQEVSLRSDISDLNATGLWSDSRTSIHGYLRSSNLSKLLYRWQVNAAALVGAQTDANFDLNWQGAPYSPSLNSLSGRINLKLGSGRIINLGDSVEAKLGFGRLLNLLSFRGDMFRNGYSFDSMKGDFKLVDGNAHTTNMRVEGTVANVGMIGRIGLAVKDFDLQLSINAHVTSSLPFIVGAATLNPIAGVATWAVDKLVSGPVSQVTTYNYHVTGTWDNPHWVPVSAR